MVVLGVLLLVSSVCLAITFYAYKIAFYNKPTGDDIYHVPEAEQYQKHGGKIWDAVSAMVSISFETVEIESWDGLKLFGRYYHMEDNAPLQIQMHGYRGCAYRDFCGGHALAREMKHNILVVDQRAHGKSQGNIISFGINERRDCAAWVDYCYRRFGKELPIFLSGVSMGAATVLMASELPLKENVVGIIADCPYSSPKEIILKVCADMKLPGRVAYPFVVLAGLIFGRFRLWSSSAVMAVKQSCAPILLLHGEDDRFVPCDMAHEIYRANPDRIRLETFPEAGHALSYMTDDIRYKKIVKEFVGTCLDNWCAE